ncbi:error-prone DNA polymerase [Aquimonas sp.]|jgi:error-prone DNA polymerase|uniref:error-prone DNA polymerase n=1 Tax=Aquimonas sp. TaxID=1872588 RepID=UPI0037BFA5AA
MATHQNILPLRPRAPRNSADANPRQATPAYAELHCLSNFSFGRGASSALELFERAKSQGYRALAITDECSLAGIVRAFEASRASGLKLITGAEFSTRDGAFKCVLLVETMAGYTALCELITQARRRSLKGEYRFELSDLEPAPAGLLMLWLPQPLPIAELEVQGRRIAMQWNTRVWLAIELHRGPDDDAHKTCLLDLAKACGLPTVACGDVHMHVRARRPLQDCLTALRHRLTVTQARGLLFANGERHLRPRRALSAIHGEALMLESLRIAERCQFELSELKYQYPREVVPTEHTPDSWLRLLTVEGARWRWPNGAPLPVQAQIEKELGLIAELNYSAYFLTVHDLVRFARSRGILCQGRGSAANSAVCFALGVTEVDPAHSTLLFERFLSKERNEPPDIDIDFEHQRREEVIQYIYTRYGRERAALAATVICYRSRSALRDAARALGLPTDQLEQLSAAAARGQGDVPIELRLAERGFDLGSPLVRRLLLIATELKGFPRHLSQHVGGFVISDAPLSTLVPVENAAMPDRTIIQWDKDDLDSLGLLKVDCLALGMLSCVRRCLDLLRAHRDVDLSPAAIPAEDAATYAMIQRADTLGVFQIESRAQMSMLPRLKPRTFYDLVIQVAIVRPGPIQGGMVHPYLRRRQGLEPVTYPSAELKAVFARTLGVPLFQEQVMQLAIVAAGYTPGEADELRRSMAAWKRRGGLEHHRTRILEGMAARGYPAAFAEQVFEQIKGFGSYGFPESHAASFALITYVSCWLKCHHPDAFACALLNAQPLGFYSTAQIVTDARRHGVRVHPIDVRYSDWDSSLEPGETARGPIRLGLREIRGLKSDAAERLLAARAQQAFRDAEDLARRAQLDRADLGLLAEAGALRGLAGHRHRARWAVAGVEAALPLFAHLPTPEVAVQLPPPSAAENLLADYARTGLTLGPHPLALLRPQLKARGCRPSRELGGLRDRAYVRLAGLVSLRQQPSTASGVTFVTLEDEDGLINLVVWQRVAVRFRRALLESRLLMVDGHLEAADGVRHLIAARLTDATELLGGLDARSRDFH